MYNTTDSSPREEGRFKAVRDLAEKLRKRPLKTIGKHKAPADSQTSLSILLGDLIEFAGYKITDPEGVKDYVSKQGEIHKAYAPFSRYNTTAEGRAITEATTKGKPMPVGQGPLQRWRDKPGWDPLAQEGAPKKEGGVDPRGESIHAKGPMVIVRGLGDEPGKPEYLRAMRVGKGTHIDPATNVPVMTRIQEKPEVPDPTVVAGQEKLYHKDRFRPRALLTAKQNIAASQARAKFGHLTSPEIAAEEKKARHEVLKKYFPEDFDAQAGNYKEWGQFGQRQRREAREKLRREAVAHRNIRAGELRMVRKIIHGRGAPLAAARAQPEEITHYVDRLQGLVEKRQEQAHGSLSHVEGQLKKIAERGVPIANPTVGRWGFPADISDKARSIWQPISAVTDKGTHWTGLPIEDVQAGEIGRHLQAGMGHVRTPVTAQRVQRLQKNLADLRDISKKAGEPFLREDIMKRGDLFSHLPPTPPPEIKGYPYLKKTGAILGGAGLLAGAIYAAKKRSDRKRSQNINFGAKWDKALRIAKEAAEEQAANVGKSGKTPAVRMTASMLYTKKASKTTSPKALPDPVKNWATEGKGSQIEDFLTQQRKQKWKIPIPSVVPTKGGWASAGITLWPKGSPPRGWPMAIRLKRVIQWHNQKQLRRAARGLSDVNSLTYQKVAEEQGEAIRGLTERLHNAQERIGERSVEHRQAGYRLGREAERSELSGAHKADLEKQRVGLVSEQSRRLNRATAIGVGATAAGIGGGYLIGRGRRRTDPDHQFSVWADLKEKVQDPETSGATHDVLTGAIEGGLAYPVSEWAYKKMIGKGTPSTLKKIVAGGAVGGLATGLIGVSVANILRAKKKVAARKRSQQEMKSKVKLIRFARIEDQPPRPPLVTKSRYSHQVVQQDYDRANRHYIQTALLGGALGAAFRGKMRPSRAILTGAGIGVGAQGLIRAYGSQHQGPYGERSWTQKRAEKTLPVVGAGVLAGKLIGKERLKKIFLSIPRRPIYFASDVEGYDPNDPLTKWSQKWLYKKNYSTEAHAQKIKKWVGRATRIRGDVEQSQAGIQPKDARGRPKKREWEKPWVAAAGTILALKGGLWGANKLRTTIANAPLESRIGQFKESFQRGNVLRKIPVLGWAVHHATGVGEDLKRLMYGPSKGGKFATTVVNPKTQKPYSPGQLAKNEAKTNQAKYWTDVATGAEKPENFPIKRDKPLGPFGPRFSSRLREVRLDVTWDDNPLYPEEGKRTVQEVPIKHIISHQDAVKRHIVEKYKKKPGRNLPTLHKIGRKYYVEDGNHRIVSKLEKGEKTVRARVLEMGSRLREIRFAQTLDQWGIGQRSGKTAVVYAPGAQKRDRSELPWYKRKGNQRHILEGAVAATGILGGLGALAYGKRAFKIGREVERANRTIGSTGKDINRYAGEALRGVGPFKVVVRPEGLPRIDPEDPLTHRRWQSNQPLIRFDDQSGQVATGAGAAGFLVGGLHKGRKALPGEDLTGRRVIRAHNRFPFLQHEGVGIGPDRISDVFHTPGMGKEGIVRSVNRESFSAGRPVYVMGRANPQAAQLAKARVGERPPYSLLRRNCQLFGDECRGAARLTRSVVPRQLRTAIAVGGASAAGAYGLNKAFTRKHEFATRDEGIDWDDVRGRAKVVAGHGIKWGGAAAAVGGVGAAALGAPFLPGATSFLKIPGRTLARKAQAGLSRAPVFKRFISAPKKDYLTGGKAVHDYIEGSQRVLNTGFHGRLIGKALQTGIADKKAKTFIGRQLRGRLGMDDWGLKHWSKFRSGHLQALGHWDREYLDLIKRKAAPHQEGPGFGKWLPVTPPDVHAKEMKRYHQGRRATLAEIHDAIENKGMSHTEAFRHVTTSSKNPHVRTYMTLLAGSKKDPMSHYPQLAVASPALVAGGGVATVGGVAAFKRDQDQR
jgi:hypothetical protein